MAAHTLPDVLTHICAQIYSSGFQPYDVKQASLSPVVLGQAAPIGLPSSHPSDTWSEPIVRQTLANLCLVNRAWSEAAKPWLWRNIPVRLPGSWLSLFEEIAGSEDVDVNDEQAALIVERSINAAAGAAIVQTAPLGARLNSDAMKRLHDDILQHLTGPYGSIPPELLSPPASRDPSPRGLRDRRQSRSPQRWQMMRSIGRAVAHVMQDSHPGTYVPTPVDPRPGRFVHHIDFSHFRTVGMRRSIEDGTNRKFVTGGRVEAVLKEMPNLISFGATEYMDSSLTLPVLKDLFLRGTPSRGRGRRELHETDAEDRERRRDCRELEAVDLAGCISSVFCKAFKDFVGSHLAEAPGLRRLGLWGVRLVSSESLSSFVMMFPSLTHLDLSGTRVTPTLLDLLGKSRTVRLQSLGLARCLFLTSESIKQFLVHSPAAEDIVELNLFGTAAFPSPLLEGDLIEIVGHAPCFIRGTMIYLDISSAPVSTELLKDTFKAQPQLRSLGLSYMENLPLSEITQFLKTKCANVEVLTLVGTSPDLRTRQASVALHTSIIRELCSPPFSIRPIPSVVAPTKLRVLELSLPMLNALGAGAGSWRVVKSKGGRGWYVLSASGWVNGIFRRDLCSEDPVHAAIEHLSNANGNVSSGVGWHARKMEVLHGYGMLGREDGLYGAVAFAYDG